MELKALVVDDEQLARDELCYLLEQAGGVTVVAQAANGVDALALIAEHAPDLVFLDVQMPGLNGFEVARQVLERQEGGTADGDPGEPHGKAHGEDRAEAAGGAEIVFVTAFDQYAIEAFQVDAVDYLLKPVDPERLDQAVQRARRRIGARTSPRMSSQAGDDGGRGEPILANAELERLVKRIAQGQGRRERLAVKVGEGFFLVDAGDVIFATLADEVVTVAATGFTGTSNYRTLDDLQAQLDPETFWRVHRAYLVNINKIKEIVPWFSRNYILKMSDAKSTEVPVSRSQTKRLREYLRL
jgi:two-component system LytT family response regulator/two-component system response regulator LytT